MPEIVKLFVNRKPIVVPAESTVAVAIAMTGVASRISVSGEPRGPLCSMGVCFECRCVIDGKPHQRSCQILCRQAMDVNTQ